MMRLAGNRAATAYIQRQPPTPAPASGASPAPVPAPSSAAQAAPTPAESAPVELPKVLTALPIVFSSGHQTTFEINDLSEFEIGQGKLETGQIPIGEFISVEATVGSHNPVKLIQPTLTLHPVTGVISVQEVGRALPTEAQQSTKQAAGSVAAAVGGILGGVAGVPFGVPVLGAQYGGLAAGKASDAVFDFFQGKDIDLVATLDRFAVSGSIGLHYTPYFRLTLGATGFDWLANLSAELQTALNLTLTGTLALSGSEVRLHFSSGKLTRTIFTLKPSATLEATLAAEGRLKLAASLLHLWDESAGRDGSLLSGEITTNPFRLFSITGTLGVESQFDLAKGSAMETLGKKVRAAPQGVRRQLVTGLKASGPNWPMVGGSNLDEKERTGLSEKSAILMSWHKPAEWYRDHLERPGKSERKAETIAKFPNQTYDNGFCAGVDFWPHPGMPLKYRGGDEPRQSGVKKFMKELREEGIELSDLPYETDIDHVVDWAFYGPDDATNLWPLERGRNRSAGTTQNRFQKVWWRNSDTAPPRQTTIEEVPHDRHLVIKDMKDPGSARG